jgi:glycosyltransferase involved in cell wall biosynthesis
MRRAWLLASVLRRWVYALARPPRGLPARVSYGRPLPAPGAVASGGFVKLQRLQEDFPNRERDFNLLYLGSNTLPPDSRALLWLAQRRRIPVAWNQDGVAYPAWHGPGWEDANRPIARGLRAAAHVFFQSAFCKAGADRFLGEPTGEWEILHNPVDTDAFTPATRPDRPLTLLLGGNQYQRYRLETALETVARLDDARLIVSGTLSWTAEREARAWTETAVRRLGLADRVELAGPYAQRDAPALLRRADVLLHTKYNDPCPTIVLEAMACGLPVVYSASGGTPELVDDDAGVGVDAPEDWERDHPPDPEALAAAVERVAAALAGYAEAARRRAVERFDVKDWVARHRAVLEDLVR